MVLAHGALHENVQLCSRHGREHELGVAGEAIDLHDEVARLHSATTAYLVPLLDQAVLSREEEFPSTIFCFNT